jgi:hypothetical protein
LITFCPWSNVVVHNCFFLWKELEDNTFNKCFYDN